MISMMTAHEARDFYLPLEIEPIPLWADTKRAITKDWQHAPCDEQWVNAPPDANIGARHGNGVVNVDCDHPATFDNVMRGLNGLGITDPPVVQTASVIGRGVYLRCNDLPNDAAYRRLSREVGAGELRYGIGSLSVLPDSLIHGVTYSLISGKWSSQPIVQWRDFQWLMPAQRAVTIADELPIPLLYRPITRKIDDLFDAVARAAKGQAIGKYPSRSEAEAAIMIHSILNGWTFDQINDEFDNRNVGHYAEAGGYAKRYLETTYVNALAAIISSPIREALASEYHHAADSAWPGRTGNSDKAAYLAFVAQCYPANAIETSASVREIAEYAAMSIDTADASMHRLVTQYGLLERTHGANDDGTHASIYKLRGDVQNRTGITELTPVRISTPLPVRISPLPELAAWDVLGKSALSVYQHLDDFDVQSIKRLAKATGRARSTVRHALERLSRYHLAIKIDGGGWLKGPNDLESVAADFDCEARAASRRDKHARQRERYRERVNAEKQRKPDAAKAG